VERYQPRLLLLEDIALKGRDYMELNKSLRDGIERPLLLELGYMPPGKIKDFKIFSIILMAL
jgi:hypothetical protein